MLCEYGCKNEAKFKLKYGKHCCSKSANSCPEIRKKNSDKLKEAHKKAGGSFYNYDDLPQETKEAMNVNKGKIFTENSDIFIENSRYKTEFLKSRIARYNLIEYKCDKCGLGDCWQGTSIVLELDHANGNNKDNRLENLRFLCPNCHSQTPTFRGRNKNSGIKKVSDEELLEAYKSEGNAINALRKVNLSSGKGNYERLERLLRGGGEIGETHQT